MSPRAVAIAQTLAVVMASSLVGVLAKLALRDVPAFSFVWLQIAIGGIILTAYTFGLRRERIPRDLGVPVWACIIGIGICNFGIVRLMIMLSLERLPATTHAYLMSFVGIVTMGISVVTLRERPSGFQVLGALLALAGLRVFFREIPPASELLGVLYLGVGVLALAGYNNLARKLALVSRGPISNNIVSTVALWIGGIPVVLAGLATDWPPPVAGWRNWGIILLAGGVSIALVLTVFNYILRTLRSYEASILATSGIIWIALFAMPILGERLVLHQIAGIAMMLVGLGLVQIRPRT